MHACGQGVMRARKNACVWSGCDACKEKCMRVVRVPEEHMPEPGIRGKQDSSMGRQVLKKQSGSMVREVLQEQSGSRGRCLWAGWCLGSCLPLAHAHLPLARHAFALSLGKCALARAADCLLANMHLPLGSRALAQALGRCALALSLGRCALARAADCLWANMHLPLGSRSHAQPLGRHALAQAHAHLLKQLISARQIRNRPFFAQLLMCACEPAA
eukprot:1158293-Pelagomonas_calceolata.AAC.11